MLLQRMRGQDRRGRDDLADGRNEEEDVMCPETLKCGVGRRSFPAVTAIGRHPACRETLANKPYKGLIERGSPLARYAAFYEAEFSAGSSSCAQPIRPICWPQAAQRINGK